MTCLRKPAPARRWATLFRRHWIPALLSEEIPSPDCPPVRVTLLSEKLIAFRDSNGNPGLVDSHCPHRGAPLFFGRNEESGIRCVYHGWKFDVTGACVDLPNSPEGETYKDKVAVKAYPCWDKGGMIWTYMGPADKEPPKPGFEWLDFGEDRRYLRKYHLRCNYFQALEGDYDPSHAFFLHSTLDNNEGNPGRRFGAGVFNSFLNRTYADYIDTDYGVMNVAVSRTSDGQQQANVGHFYMPCYSSAGISGPDVYASNMRIPIDDESCYMYRLRWSYNPFTQQQVQGGQVRRLHLPRTDSRQLHGEGEQGQRLPCRPDRPEELFLHGHQGLPHPGPRARRGPVGPACQPEPRATGELG